MDSNMTSRSTSPCLDSAGSTAPSTPPQIEHISLPSLCSTSSDCYSRWRPSYHLMPRSGWMNDPCAPGYNSETGEYFVSFQWNPDGPDWGDICWGTAFSKDLLNWEVLGKPTLRPDTAYDSKGVFTGCALPRIGAVDGQLTVVYTSVNHLPIHHTLQHVQCSESLAIATSDDGGRSWTKMPANPILPHEPVGLDVTGWRDPFVAPWPSMSRTLGIQDESTLFAIISGGIRDVTPTSFLYAILPSNPTQWNYIGPLTNVGLNARLSNWSGDMGRNWEVTNFVSLADDDEPSAAQEYLIMGTEGCLPTSSAKNDSVQPTRPARGQLWMSGKLRKTASTDRTPALSPVHMSYDYGGHLDHGCFYAANSFRDPVCDKQVVWGWITEDDLCDKLRHDQGWSGMLSLPRELRVQTIRRVTKACNSELEDITNIGYERDDKGTYTVRTLGSTPVERVQQGLRDRPGVMFSQIPATVLNCETSTAGFLPDVIRATQWELRCSFLLSSRCRTIGLHLDHSTHRHTRTTIQFQPSNETVTILRPSPAMSNSKVAINAAPETAPHTLFTTRDPSTGRESQENLELHIWRDNSVLEVFVNGRTAISTRIYTTNNAQSIRFFADDDDSSQQHSAMLDAKLWDGIGCATEAW